MIRSTLLAAGALIALASCGTVPNAGALLFDIPTSCGTSPGASTNMICAGSDLVQVVANKPAPRRTFDYSETDAFDLQLSSSLGANLEKVTVNVPAAINLPSEEISAQALPSMDSQRIVFWLAQVRNSGGEVKACPLLESALIDWLFARGTDYIKARLTYAPAEKYNALLYIDTASDGVPIRKAVFTPRDGNALTCS